MEFKDRRSLYLVTLSVSIAFLTAGVTSGWTGVAMHAFKHKPADETGVDINMKDVWIMTTSIPIGFCIGGLAMRFIADRFGRRSAILVSTVPVAVGSVVVAFAKVFWVMCVGVMLKNIGTGVLSSVIGIYHAEIADKDVRGTLAFISGFMFKLGLLVIMGLGPYSTYPMMNYSIIPLPFVAFLVCLWIPETPYYCLKEGKVENARISLKRLRNNADDVNLEKELDSLKLAVSKETKQTGTIKELFLAKQYRKSVIIAFGLKFAAMLTGSVMMTQYISWIVVATHIKNPTEQIMLIYSIISFSVGVVSTFIVDRVGRKTLMFYSFLGTAVALSIVGLYFFLNNVAKIPLDELSPYAMVPIVAIIVVNVISNMGFSSLIHIVPAEVFPMNVKEIAMTSLHIFGAILGAVNGKLFFHLYFCSGRTCTPPYAYSAYWIFAFFGFGGALFTRYCLIETKGKELSEIQRELQGSDYDKEAGPRVEDTEMEEIEILNKVQSTRC